MFGTRLYKTVWLTSIGMMAAGTFTGNAAAQESDPQALLGRMSAEIAALDSFILSGELYVDARLAAGQIIEHSSEVTMRIRKPTEMRITTRDAEGTNELYFGGGVLTLYREVENLYAQTVIPEAIEAAAEFALTEVGIDAPLLDFVSNNIAEQLQEDAEEVRHLETSLIRGSIFEHIAIRTPEIDIQLWIAAEGPPLPGKMVISSKWEGGAPRTVLFLNWDTDPTFPSDNLEFVPPQDASEIEFVLDSQP